MEDGIEICSEYGGLTLTCREKAFARVSSHILAEPSVAKMVANLPGRDDVRFVSVRMPPVEHTSWTPGWLAVIPTIVAGALSGVALIVGYVTIAQWLLRFFV
jgi:hypothetical protein